MRTGNGSTVVVDADGLRVPVAVHGDGGPPLVFVPGLGVHPVWYEPALARLGSHFTVFTPDFSFRTHDSLPQRVLRYRACVEELAERLAPDAPRIGHSLGGLVALMGTRRAVALSPMIPVPVGWPAKIARAALLQLREYFGLEGPRGARWAWGILRDYLWTAVRKPACLFPAVSETLGAFAQAFLPTAPSAHVVLARHDSLYRASEYRAWLGETDPQRISVREVPRGHDWPVTHPALVEREVLEVLGAPDRTRAATPGTPGLSAAGATSRS
jgi:pimeloyl-ACP methyl ester carboxylesterase